MGTGASRNHSPTSFTGSKRSSQSSPTLFENCGEIFCLWWYLKTRFHIYLWSCIGIHHGQYATIIWYSTIKVRNGFVWYSRTQQGTQIVSVIEYSWTKFKQHPKRPASWCDAISSQMRVRSGSMLLMPWLTPFGTVMWRTTGEMIPVGERSRRTIE